MSPLREFGIALTALTALALAPMAAAERSVAFIDTQRAISESSEGKAARAQLGALLERENTDLEPDRRKIEAIQKQLQSDKFLLSTRALTHQRLELALLRRQYERDTTALEDRLELARLELFQPIELRLARVIKQIGEEKKLAMIVDRATTGLLYFDDDRDLTALVIKKLDSDS